MTGEETIKWLESLKAEIGKSEHRTLWHYSEAIDTAIEALERYDSEGYWENREHVKVDEDGYAVATCSICGSEITLEYPYDNYCPNCGTWMHGKVAWK